MTKRLLDLLLASTGLLVALPLFVVVGIAIKAADRGPVFFRQTRLGRWGRPFRIWKFRTMRVNAEALGPSVTKSGDPRVTPIGRFLRKWKLDELPQLINVLFGEMSFVGPRPEVPKYVALYSPEQRQVLDLRPGITDVASLEFRHEEALLAKAADPEEYYRTVCIPKKIELNLRHAKESSVGADLRVILRTIAVLFQDTPKH
jgi:lipopolysaccharide/colanic/teichoic acid biosynthesis glycosyltransferase